MALTTSLAVLTDPIPHGSSLELRFDRLVEHARDGRGAEHGVVPVEELAQVLAAEPELPQRPRRSAARNAGAFLGHPEGEVSPSANPWG